MALSDAEKEAQRLQNILAGVGCPHGRMGDPPVCTPCWVDAEIKRKQQSDMDASMRQRAMDDGFQG